MPVKHYLHQLNYPRKEKILMALEEELLQEYGLLEKTLLLMRRKIQLKIKGGTNEGKRTVKLVFQIIPLKREEENQKVH